MKESLMLGIDCGGTHTDAALLTVRDGTACLLAKAKTKTDHDNLPHSIVDVLGIIAGQTPQGAWQRVERVTLGTTLAINAVLQGKADPVGLAVTAGPGLNPAHFVLGDHVCIVPGGLDHRGVEVDKLYTASLKQDAIRWAKAGVRAVALVGKFSPRNPAHENTMAEAVKSVCNLPITLGHELSGKLNFPRRIATAYYNAAVAAIHNQLLDAVTAALGDLNGAALRLLKADGGATTFASSRQLPIQSLLSGPAASVMGVMAAWHGASEGCSLLVDMGGTTSDIALLLNGSPVVARDGMVIIGRHTLVRSLATISVAIGGDSLLKVKKAASDQIEVQVGPEREGFAMAFGGSQPTLLDAFNVIGPCVGGDATASLNGITALATQMGLTGAGAEEIARKAVQYATTAVVKAVYELVEDVNSGPIYTLAALKAAKEARPSRACLVGGPAAIVQSHLAQALGLPVELSPHPDVANAIGAALTRPTASLEVYADTGKGELWVPALNIREKIRPNTNLDAVESRARELLTADLAANGMEDAQVEVVEADLFATLDDYGRGSRDMRVTCQAVPGIVATIRQ